MSLRDSARGSHFRSILISCVVLVAGLVVYGKARFPNINLLSLFGALLVLALYGVGAWFGATKLESMPAPIARVARLAGLLAGGIFTLEIILEYVLLPTDNTRFGLVEFGLVFAIYFGAGALVGYRQLPFRWTLITGVATAVISSLLWYLFILATFYLFFGTERQARVFRAEGNYEDFSRSGMADFNTFIMEDFLGAGFFHLLLGPILAGVLAGLGGLVGRGLMRIRKQWRA